MLSWAALLAGLSSASVIAEIPAGTGAWGSNELVSKDGYHYAYLKAGPSGEKWIKDGRVVAEAPPGTYFDDCAFSLAENQRRCALSEDGSTLAAVRHIYDAGGRKIGYGVEVNGRAKGPVFEDIQALTVGSKGHVGYFGLQAGVWRAVSAKGTGPALENKPTDAFVSNTGVMMYLGYKDGNQYLFLDHKGIRPWEGFQIEPSPDWSRLGGPRIYQGRTWMMIDDEQLGPYAGTIGLSFAEDGRGYAYFYEVTDNDGYRGVVVNGKSFPTNKPYRFEFVFRPRDSLAHWLVHETGGVAIAAGGSSGEVWDSIQGKPFLAFSPSGANRAFMAYKKGGKNHIVVNGEARPVADGFWGPAGLVFDNEDEFHALVVSLGEVKLLCGSVRPGLSADQSVCVRRSRGLYKAD